VKLAIIEPETDKAAEYRAAYERWKAVLLGGK
jgi:hypothetical protein